jgi:hypothetical protein
MNGCRACGLDFASVSAFDRHRTGKHEYTFAQGLERDTPVEDGRKCLDESEMRVVGMEVDARGRWCITADAERARLRFGGSRTSPEARQEESVAA